MTYKAPVRCGLAQCPCGFKQAVFGTARKDVAARVWNTVIQHFLAMHRVNPPSGRGERI